ncbi:MAG TPA: TonB family protein [Candidatus Sulfotelmatobacter sp.]|nr:TonB family protein [Candidatus Sulfotelmatobacter sp.]
MKSALRWFLPWLVLFPCSSVAQVAGEPSRPIVDSVCLDEILISTPQPYKPEEIDAAKRKADSAREAIRQGADFGDLAKKYSDGPTAPRGGILGRFKRGQLSKSIEDTVFAMKTGDVSDVIRTKQGFAILKVDDCGAQTSSTETRDQAPSNSESGGKGFGAVEILSDTHGVDLGPYLKDALEQISRNWYREISQSAETKKGKLAIEFAINRDGGLAAMKLVAVSGDAELDRAAWAGIRACDPFKPLPEKFDGQSLALRLRFYYNPNKSDLKP